MQRGLGTPGDSGWWHSVSPIPRKGQSRAGHPVREMEQHQDSAGTAIQETECPQIPCLEKRTLMGLGDCTDQHSSPPFFATDTVKLVQLMWNQ